MPNKLKFGAFENVCLSHKQMTPIARSLVNSPANRDRHAGFHGQIGLDDKRVVVAGEQGDLAGTVQAQGKPRIT